MFKSLGKSLCGFSEISNSLLGPDRLIFKELVSDDELAVLQSGFKAADGIELPISYLKQGRAFICYNESMIPQGGFALIETGPFRSLAQIPHAGDFPLERLVCELTAVWLKSGTSIRRSRFWSFVVGTALSSRAPNVIYAVDTSKVALRKRIFNHIRSFTIYEGPVQMLEGMQAPSVEAIELADKQRLATGFLKLAMLELKNVSRPGIGFRRPLTNRETDASLIQ